MVEEKDMKSNSQIDVLSSITHEIRTPLNCIKGFIEIAIKDPSLKDETKEHLKRALNSTKRMQTMVNDMLDLGVIMGTGKFHIYPRWFLLGDMIGPIQYDCAHLFSSPDVKFKVDIPEKVRTLRVRSDPSRLRQVLINLIDNASKNTIRGFVELKCRSKGEMIKLNVKDTGMGISNNNIGSIFEPFYQESSGPDRISKGTGIGLSISKEIIQRLNGTIEVDSIPGKGTDFTISLPQESQRMDMVENLIFNSRKSG